jgi:hypothetical protein
VPFAVVILLTQHHANSLFRSISLDPEIFPGFNNLEQQGSGESPFKLLKGYFALGILYNLIVFLPPKRLILFLK